jgi:putative heme iron utilization protein
MIATGTAMVIAAGLGAVTSIGSMAMVGIQQSKAKKESMAMLEKMNAQGAERQKQMAQFLQQSGYGDFAGRAMMSGLQ